MYNIVCKKVKKDEVDEVLLADFQIFQENILSKFLKSVSEMVVVVWIKKKNYFGVDKINY